MKEQKLKKDKQIAKQKKSYPTQCNQWVDKRSMANSQMKTIQSISSLPPLQLAVSFEPSVPHDSLCKSKRSPLCIVREDANEIVIGPKDAVTYPPGFIDFTKNIGRMEGYVQESLNGANHSEPLLISKIYGPANGVAEGGWDKAIEAITKENERAGGLDKRSSFELYTERIPCSEGPSCMRQLSNDKLFKSEDKVKYSFSGASTGAEDVAKSYFEEAKQLALVSGKTMFKEVKKVEGRYRLIFKISPTSSPPVESSSPTTSQGTSTETPESK